MFGFGKNKKSKTDKRQKKSKKAQKSKKELQASCDEGKSESQRIREEALANARAAREHIGEETIQKIVEAMAKKQNNPMERAKAQLANVDSDRIADEILYMLDDK